LGKPPEQLHHPHAYPGEQRLMTEASPDEDVLPSGRSVLCLS